MPSTQTVSTGQSPVPWPDVWPISVDRYHSMIEAGILGPDDRVELLQGRLVEKMPKNPPHAVANRLIDIALAAAVPAGWTVTNQSPLTTADSEPEPDVMVFRGSLKDYLHRHPTPAEVPLVVETADSSLGHDRGIKRLLYAAAAVENYWIANLVDRQIEWYSRPVNGDYTEISFYLPGDEIPVVLGGNAAASIPVERLLP